nr:uncharacterized protein LOC118037452 isoform X3 [Populus alba]
MPWVVYGTIITRHASYSLNPSRGQVYSGYANSRHRQQIKKEKENPVVLIISIQLCQADGAKRVEDGVVYLDATIHLPLFLIFCYYFPCIRGSGVINFNCGCLLQKFQGFASVRQVISALVFLCPKYPL